MDSLPPPHPSEHRHIKFTDDVIVKKSASRASFSSRQGLDGERGLSAESLGPTGCRRIFACFSAIHQLRLPLSPPSKEDGIDVPLVTPLEMEHILSTEFETGSASKLGTRRLSVHLGPFAKPMGGNHRWDSHDFSSASSGPSLLSMAMSEKLASISDNNSLHVTAVGFDDASGVEIGCDQCVEKELLDIATGKGGMFTRAVYSVKKVAAVLAEDLNRADIVLVMFIDGKMSFGSCESGQSPCGIKWSPQHGILSITPVSNEGDPIPPAVAFILEAFRLDKHIVIYAPSMSDSIDAQFRNLLDVLAKCSHVVRFHNILDVESVLASSIADKMDLPSRTIPPSAMEVLPIGSMTGAISWIASIAKN